MIGQVVKPVVALLVGLSGAWAAWVWFENGDPLGFSIAIILFLLGLALDGLGQNKVRQSPRISAWLMEAWILVPISAAVAAGALIIIITVEWAIPDPPAASGAAEVAGSTLPASTKEVVGAVTTAVTGFLTAAFISWTEDKPGEGVMEHIEGVFKDSFEGRFRPGSMGQMLVFADPVEGTKIRGWDFDARHKRAKALQAEIRNRTSDPLKQPTPPP